MARKEKKSTAGRVKVPTAGLVCAGLACLFGVIAASGYLWQKGEINTLGQQIRGYEMRLDEAKRRRLTLDRIYAEMCSPAGPAGLEARVKRSRLEIGPPQLDQIVRLWEPVPTGSADHRLAAVKKEGQSLLTSAPTEGGFN